MLISGVLHFFSFSISFFLVDLECYLLFHHAPSVSVVLHNNYDLDEGVSLDYGETFGMPQDLGESELTFLVEVSDAS